jgi:hypothetical protein
VVDAVADVVTNYATQLDNEARQFQTSYGPVGMGAGITLPPCTGARVVGAAFNAGSSSPQQVLYQNYYVEQCNLILS